MSNIPQHLRHPQHSLIISKLQSCKKKKHRGKKGFYALLIFPSLLASNASCCMHLALLHEWSFSRSWNQCAKRNLRGSKFSNWSKLDDMCCHLVWCNLSVLSAICYYAMVKKRVWTEMHAFVLFLRCCSLCILEYCTVALLVLKLCFSAHANLSI